MNTEKSINEVVGNAVLQLSSHSNFMPMCGKDRFEICSENSDANCFKERPGYAYKAVVQNANICSSCVYYCG